MKRVPAFVLPVAFCLIPVVAGLISVQRGKSAGWDWTLYHHYSAYAYLTAREAIDILPTGLRSFWNPLVELPFYACTTWLPARACGFAAGFVHGLNYVLLVPIAALALRGLPYPHWVAAGLPWLLALAGALGAGSLGMLGGANNDNLVSLFFLASLLILMREADRGGAARIGWVLMAGFSIGLGCGLKLTLAAFGVGIICGPLFFALPWPRRLGLAIACGLGAMGGLLVAAGPLMLRMAHLYGNPLFPYFGGLFGGPYAEIANARDLRYLPGSVTEALFYPFVFAVDPLRVSEFVFRDFRLPGIVLLVLLVGLTALVRRLQIRLPGVQAHPGPLSPQTRVLLGVLAISYVVWMAQSSVYRYLFPIEILSFAVMTILLSRVFRPRGQIIALAVLALFIVPTTSPLASRRLAWGGDRFLSVAMPPAPVPEPGALVLLAGNAATTYVIPTFPSDIRIIGVDTVYRLDFFATGDKNENVAAEERELGPFGPAMRAVINGHRGQLLGLFNASEATRVRARAVFAGYGLTFEPSRCGEVQSNVAPGNPLLLCELSAL